MGIQVVIEASASEIEATLGDMSAECELFPMSSSRCGLSIPRKVVDSYGEERLRARLSKLKHFDLWKGQWTNATK